MLAVLACYLLAVSIEGKNKIVLKNVLIGFEIAGADGAFRPAEARIAGKDVIVSSPDVPAPAAVHYGWANDPHCNLFNHEHLPASPFAAQLGK